MHILDMPLLSGASLTGHLREIKDDRFGLFHRLNRECGDIGRISVLGVPLVFANGPSVLHEVLVEKARSFIKSPGLRGPLKPFAGQGLFTSEGELWRQLRKLMAPLFTHARIERYAADMAECAAHAIAGLAWSLYLLGRHPEAYARARAEARGLPGPATAKVTRADLPALGYCLRVFKEAMRLYPPIYFFGRQATADVTVGGYELPRGTVVLISSYALHHRAAIWPDPERFDPSRFEPAAEEARHRQAYLPFSAGPRTCIGNLFALMEGPIVLATILRHVDPELTSQDVVEPEAYAMLRPAGGVPMRVKAVEVVVSKVAPSVHAAYQEVAETLPVSITSVYNKLNKLGPGVTSALVHPTACRLAPVIVEMDGQIPALLPGYRARILDGNHLAATARRLRVLHQSKAGPSPGHALVVLDPALMLATNMIPCEDGHAQERSLSSEILALVEANDVWIADRNFCTFKLLSGIAAQKAFFCIRQHANLTVISSGTLRACGGTETGQVFEQAVTITTAKGGSLKARRIVLRLDKPTRDGDAEMAILTNLPKGAADAGVVANLYRKR